MKVTQHEYYIADPLLLLILKWSSYGTYQSRGGMLISKSDSPHRNGKSFKAMKMEKTGHPSIISSGSILDN